MGSDDSSGDHDYLAREAKARVQIDKQLTAAGWVIQSQGTLNLAAGPGVAVREFTLEKPHGRVDYLLFLNGQPAGVIEAKPEGTTLTEVERQSGKYVEGLPDWIKPAVYPLPFIYESAGTETRFTNGYDPEARSRRVFTFQPFAGLRRGWKAVGRSGPEWDCRGTLCADVSAVLRSREVAGSRLRRA